MLTEWFHKYEMRRAALVRCIRWYGYKNVGKLGKKGLGMEIGRWNVRDAVGKLIQKSRKAESTRIGKEMPGTRTRDARKWCEMYTSKFVREAMLRGHWDGVECPTQLLYNTEQGKVDPVLMCADRLYVDYWHNVHREIRQARTRAFLMGTHPRLGKQSPVHVLDPDQARMVWNFV
jgi:hypothetical protein